MRNHRSPVFGIILASCLLALPDAVAQDNGAPAPAPCCGLSLEQLLHMSKPELAALYCQACPGPIPDGPTCGKAIRWAGTRWCVPNASATGCLWKGKLFNGCDGTMLNRWCLGIKAVPARVYCGASWLDGKPAIIMDYRGMSALVWKNVRDELRAVAPGLYLGVMYKDQCPAPKFQMFFALEVAGTCE
jgi:hypothetical protein